LLFDAAAFQIRGEIYFAEQNSNVSRSVARFDARGAINMG
jgi:hypothetical protein